MSTNSRTTAEHTEVGSYFVANYPPFSVWSREDVDRMAKPALQTPPVPGVPLGLYLHIPFCRQACHYCNLHFSTSLNRKNDFIAALLREIKERKDYIGAERVETARQIARRSRIIPQCVGRSCNLYSS